MNLEAPKNVNYAAVVVRLKDFVDLPNCDRVKAALLFGNSVIVAKECVAGELGLFFPVECELSKQFLTNNNLYRKPELGNVDPAKMGFFEASGRVRAVKFRGHKSEGFWIPIDALAYTGIAPGVLPEGVAFDRLGDLPICSKYIPAGAKGRSPASAGRGRRSLEESIVEGQFRFHFDTDNLRRNIDKLWPTDMVSVSDKWHGTSVVIGMLLVKQERGWWRSLLQRLSGAGPAMGYGLVYSSRRVIKAVNGAAKSDAHFYSEDIWGVVARESAGRIPHGFTLYGEIVGYTPSGEAIQKGYTYGCAPGEHMLIVYRVTLTTDEGRTVELAWPQMVAFCAKYGFAPPKEFFFGPARYLAPHAVLALGVERWRSDLLAHLEATYVTDADCLFNAKGTPAEGIVLRIDRLEECRSYKLKNFRFLERESTLLDSGVLDTETAESFVADSEEP